MQFSMGFFSLNPSRSTPHASGKEVTERATPPQKQCEHQDVPRGTVVVKNWKVDGMKAVVEPAVPALTGIITFHDAGPSWDPQ